MRELTKAILLQHPSAPVTLIDPRHQAVTEDAIDALALPAPIEMPSADDFERLDALNGLGNLMAKYGAPRVMRWVKFLASINGEAV